MKFCPVVPEICRGQVHGARKERRITRIIIIIIIRNGAKTISLQTLFGRLNKMIQTCREKTQFMIQSCNYNNIYLSLVTTVQAMRSLLSVRKQNLHNTYRNKTRIHWEPQHQPWLQPITSIYFYLKKYKDVLKCLFH